MRHELLYQEKLEDVKIWSMKFKNDLYGLNKIELDDMKNWHLFKNSLLMSADELGKIKT